MKKIKLLWYGDSPTANTGFGNVSRNILRELYKTKEYDITVLGIQYFEDPLVDLPIKEGMPYRIISAGNNHDRDMFGRKKLLDLLEAEKFDILLTLQDLQNLDTKRHGLKRSIRSACNVNKTKWIIYTPIDGQAKRQYDMLPVREADKVVFYTYYGANEIAKLWLEEAGNLSDKVKNLHMKELADKSSIIYHGTKPNLFKPTKVGNFRREYFGINDDDFLIININRNQPRKDLQRTIEAYCYIKNAIPKVKLYLHCHRLDIGGNMDEIIEAYGARDVILPKDLHPIFGIPEEKLNLIYNSANVFITTTLGEGWGLPITEAMCAGLPIVMPCHSSLKEIGEGRAIFCKTLGTQCQHEDFYRLRQKTDAEDMARKVIDIYRGAIDTRPLTQNAINWARSISWEKIGKDWHNLIKEVKHA